MGFFEKLKSGLGKTKNSINECRRLNVEIKSPMINISTYKYEVLDDTLIYPLSLIKGIGTLTAKNIVKEREEMNSDKCSGFSFRLN